MRQPCAHARQFSCHRKVDGIQTSRNSRDGFTLIEMLMMISFTGALMLLTVRTMHLATLVHESGIQTATHLRLVNTLEDRLRSDISRCVAADAISANTLRLKMRSFARQSSEATEPREVYYRLVKPNLIERRTSDRRSDENPVRDGGFDTAVANQRWQFTINYQITLALEPVEKKTLVRFKLHREPNKDQRFLLRDVEISEVTYGD